VHLLVFEQLWEEHGPLARTRPVLALRCGTMSLGDRLAAHYQPAAVFHQVRAALAPVHAELLARRGSPVRVNELAAALAADVLIVDGAVLAGTGGALPAAEGGDEVGIVHDVIDHAPGPAGRLEPVRRPGGRIAYVRLRRATAAALLARCGPDLPALLAAARADAGIAARPVPAGEIEVMTYPWQLLERNGAAIRADHAAGGSRVAASARVDPTVAWLRDGARVPPPGSGPGAAAASIGAETVIGAFVSLDVSEGPILIGANVVIQPHAHIEGPAYIGDGSTVWAHAHLKPGCSLGPRSRVCGQLEEVILQGLMHKFHAGFLGHSYVGEGVNLGDQTVTSNLKNDRTPVEVHLAPGPLRRIDTGRLYVGSLLGDGVATGTNTNLTTGCVVEPLSCIVSAEATPKYVSGLLLRGRPLPWPFASAYNAFRILVSERLAWPLPEGHETLFRQVYADLKATRRRLRLEAGAARFP